MILFKPQHIKEVYFWLLLGALFLHGCHGDLETHTRLQKRLQSEGPLKIVMIANPQTLWKDQLLVEDFTKTYQLKSQIIWVKNNSQAQTLMKSNKADLIAATLPFEDQKYSINGPYFKNYQWGIFCPKESTEQCFLEEQETGYFKTLSRNKWDWNFHPLKQSAAGWSYSWRKPQLGQLLQIWHRKIMRENKLNEYNNKFQNIAFDSSRFDRWMFQKKVETVLPKYEKLLKNWALKSGVEWQWLAATSYQESHWDPQATSPTGVKGFMQVTQATSEKYNAFERQHEEESIRSGALHLKTLYRNFPQADSVSRWALTLASYNAGLGYVQKIQEDLRAKNLDPFAWKNIRAALAQNSTDAKAVQALQYVDRILVYRLLL